MTEKLLSKHTTIALFATAPPPPLPTQARVVVIGAGIVGCSVAYHLAKRGWTDVVVLERGRLACGTTWHAAGQITQVRASHTLTQLASFGADFYEKLAADSGLPTGFKRIGSLTLARTPPRMTELKYYASAARLSEIEAQLLAPEDLRQLWPLVQVDDLLGGLYIPTDGTLNPGDAALALASLAYRLGVRFFERTPVTGLHLDDHTVTGVETGRGALSCQYVINCAGLWAPRIGAMCGVSVPLHAVEHKLLVTTPVPGANPSLPILRDLDGSLYIRHYNGAFVIGAFEKQGYPRTLESIPSGFEFGEFEVDPGQFSPLLSQARHRLPDLQAVGVERYLNAPESFTPDNNFLLGPAAELVNFFIAAGFNSQGIIYAPAAGRLLAEWLVDGAASMDLTEVDLARFAPFQSNPRYLYERTAESLGRLYAMHWPYLQVESARPVRRSPLYDRLASQGACFGEQSGWEWANWYAPPGVKPEYAYSFERQNWFDYSRQEHRAVREAVGIFDLSSFSKFILEGPGAESALQWICAADLSVPVGKVVYTLLLNRRGGIEADLTVTRLAPQRYYIITRTSAQARDFHLIRDNLPPGAFAILTDVTSAHGVMAVMGPNARRLLSRLTDADLSNDAFPYLAAREIDLAYGRVLALRVTYVGELGWEIHAPIEFMLGIYDAVLQAGSGLGLRHAGYHALDSLRSEKGYRHWGHDIGPLDNPYQAGLGFTLALEKAPDFIGRQALIAHQGAPSRRLAFFMLAHPGPLLYREEPIYRDGVMVGHLTSGAYGHTLGSAVGMGYIRCDAGVTAEYVRSGRFEIEIASQRHAARASLQPFFDPKGLKIRV